MNVSSASNEQNSSSISAPLDENVINGKHVNFLRLFFGVTAYVITLFRPGTTHNLFVILARALGDATAATTDRATTGHQHRANGADTGERVVAARRDMPRQKEPLGSKAIELTLRAIDGYLGVIARVEGLEPEKSVTPPLAAGVELGEKP